jgi:hypothetical protein
MARDRWYPLRFHALRFFGIAELAKVLNLQLYGIIHMFFPINLSLGLPRACQGADVLSNPAPLMTQTVSATSQHIHQITESPNEAHWLTHKTQTRLMGSKTIEKGPPINWILLPTQRAQRGCAVSTASTLSSQTLHPS